MKSYLLVPGLACLLLAFPASALELGVFGGYQTHEMGPTEALDLPPDFSSGNSSGVTLTQPVRRFRFSLTAEWIPLSEEVDRTTWNFDGRAYYLAADYVLTEPVDGAAILVGGAWGLVISHGGSGVIDAGQPWESKAETDGSGPLYQLHAGVLWSFGRWSLQPRVGYRWATANGAYFYTNSRQIDIVYDGLVVQLGLGFRL